MQVGDYIKVEIVNNEGKKYFDGMSFLGMITEVISEDNIVRLDITGSPALTVPCGWSNRNSASLPRLPYPITESGADEEVVAE